MTFVIITLLQRKRMEPSRDSLLFRSSHSVSSIFEISDGKVLHWLTLSAGCSELLNGSSKENILKIFRKFLEHLHPFTKYFHTYSPFITVFLHGKWKKILSTETECKRCLTNSRRNIVSSLFSRFQNLATVLQKWKSFALHRKSYANRFYKFIPSIF